jgi:DNA helicase HerA-like ATPase
VIDIEPLPDYLQYLVFGDVVDTIYKIKLGEEEAIDINDFGKVVIFADELNKYAPKASDSRRTLTANLLEITERGRSLGTILFGAEQFRSGVHDRVLGNCSTNVFGRTSPVEIEKCPDYRYFPGSYKSSIIRLPQGSLLLQHAVFKTSLIKVQFPYPSYFQPRA